MTATRTSTGSADAPLGGPVAEARPRIGLLGIMQALYDEMLPGITERQAAYAQELADSLAGEADVVVAPPVKDRDDAERAMHALESEGLDGLLVVMLTYGPAMRVARLLAETRLPICLANVQPVGEVTAEWDMADLTYNQGIHGAQDTANAMVRAGRAFHVITDDWRAPSFAPAVGRWARAAAAVTRWRSLRVGVFGYAMNGMGDIQVDVHSLLRVLGPEVVVAGARRAGSRGRRRRGDRGGDRGRGRAVRDRPAPVARRARGPRADAGGDRARAGGGRLPRVLDPLRRDRRGRPLRAPAAGRRVEPDGARLRLRRGGRRADGGADVGRPRAARRDAVHRDVRDGLRDRLDPHVAHGRGQLAAGEARTARSA